MSLYVWFTTIRSLLGQSLLVIIFGEILLLRAVSLFRMRISQMKISEWFSRSLPLIITILHEFSFGWLTIVDCDCVILLKQRIYLSRILIILSRRGWLSPAVVPLIVLTNV